MADLLNVNQTVEVKVSYLNSDEAPGVLDSVPTMVEAHPETASIEMAPDGSSFKIIPIAVGPGHVDVTAVSQGNTVVGAFDYNVGAAVNAQVTHITFSPGTPQPK